MKLQFLGTAAAEGFPSPFCACAKCKRARLLGGRNLRTRSQALIDGTLLIDLNADTLSHSLRWGVDLTRVNHCLITHAHGDHWAPDDLVYLKEPFSHVPKDWDGFTIYGSQDLQPMMETVCSWGVQGVRHQVVEAFQPFTVGRYTVTALKAHHGTKNPFVYAIADGKKTLLYAHDTDIFKEDTWAYLRASGLRFDLVSLDCTEGAMEELNYHGHGCLGRDIRFRQMLKDAGVADENTRFVLNHFSHNGLHGCYDDFAPIAAKEGFITAYDGLELEM